MGYTCRECGTGITSMQMGDTKGCIICGAPFPKDKKCGDCRFILDCNIRDQNEPGCDRFKGWEDKS